MKSILLFATVLRIIFITALLGFIIFANAQSVALNTTGNPADASAMLDVSSTSKGFLAPRMTTQQRTGIMSPANGLLVFDTDTKSYWFFSQIWKEITDVNGGSFSLPYAGSFADPAKIFTINNTTLSDGAAAIYGKSGNTGSGFTPAFSTAVWGDNSSGVGLLGSSITGHGVYGTSGHSFYSGVYGTNTNGGYGVMGQVSNGTALYGLNNGASGNAGEFRIDNSSNTGNGVYVVNYGAGRGMQIANSNLSSNAEAVNISQSGLGRGLFIGVSNTSNNENAVIINSYSKNNALQIYANNTTGSGYLISGSNSGLGGGIDFSLFNPAGGYDGVRILNKGTGNGLSITAEKGYGGLFINKTTTTSTLIEASNHGANVAGNFNNYNATNSVAVLSAYTAGTGPGLVINNGNLNAVTSLATFKKNGTNKARIDGTGKGFFNGGTQTSGADMAEAFDVNGNINEYEPGDVLIISIDKDRSVERSNQSYSSLVAGVYATKPGVLMTEENIDTDISDKVPMGVLGVIPTKVCLEGGEIKRGDLLVTSSTTGVAMKADINKVKPGQVIGKALENFNSSSMGKIRVLVNVK